MSRYETLKKGIKHAAAGYLFLYFNININNFNVLPAFAGYLFFLSAIKHLQEEERELALLKNIGQILFVWNLITWGCGLLYIDIDWQFINLLCQILNLYFHFQLLTNLASIAEKYQKEVELDGKMLSYRSIQTIILTVVTIINCFAPWLTDVWQYCMITMVLVYVMIGACLIKVLLDLAGCFPGVE